MQYLIQIKEYIKLNKFYISIMFLGLFALAFQMNFVVLYADDFGLEYLNNRPTLLNIFNRFYEYYMSWGGGFHVLISMFIQLFNINIWKIFNCFLIFTMVIMSVKMISYNRKINKGLIALILWICIFLLSIYISREAIYWLNGSLVYVLSGFQVFILFYYLYSKLIMKKSIRKYDLFLLPIVSFFAGWSNAQSGIIALMLSIILLLWVKFIKKEKIKLLYIISVLLTFIGFLVFYFAPGNTSRLDVFIEFSNFNILQKILYRVDSIYGLIFDFKSYPLTGIPFYFLLVIRYNSLHLFKTFK